MIFQTCKIINLSLQVKHCNRTQIILNQLRFCLIKTCLKNAQIRLKIIDKLKLSQIFKEKGFQIWKKIIKMVTFVKKYKITLYIKIPLLNVRNFKLKIISRNRILSKKCKLVQAFSRTCG